MEWKELLSIVLDHGFELLAAVLTWVAVSVSSKYKLGLKEETLEKWCKDGVDKAEEWARARAKIGEKPSGEEKMEKALEVVRGKSGFKALKANPAEVADKVLAMVGKARG